ncbi:MAG: DNA-processing protein DprA [Anaerolineaceae bacterium]|nr:DNA-processing protein DprA [Anaerolineaceae bacterium]
MKDTLNPAGSQRPPEARLACLGLSLVSGIGPRRLERLRRYFDDIGDAWLASEQQLAQAGLDRRLRGRLVALRRELDLEREVERIRARGAEFLTLLDDGYPEALRNISDPPLTLYFRGELLPGDRHALGLVGTRKATSYGRDVAGQLAQDLARQGITVISGLAYGIDAAAHRGALKGGGRTLAVLGSGVDVIYPANHRQLAQEICRNGALISEYPPGTLPEGRNFPRRNRLISGLSLGILVVQAPLTSGAIITANIAGEQGREVFAVPGNILDPASAGCHRLIQDGAKLVTGIGDILDELNLAWTRAESADVARQVVPANESEARLLALLEAEPTHVDDLARKCQMPVATVSSTLTILELRGLARKVGPMQYSRSQPV